LQEWTNVATQLTVGNVYRRTDEANGVAVDPGEAVGLSPARLTLTFGFGPSRFEAGGVARFDSAARDPPSLRPAALAHRVIRAAIL